MPPDQLREEVSRRPRSSRFRGRRRSLRRRRGRTPRCPSA
uniref:Uncharacterized protein n=1 Tax=Arundo donax TaxID=35708 RepID=A0A0A9EE62_ARUDO